MDKVRKVPKLDFIAFFEDCAQKLPASVTLNIKFGKRLLLENHLKNKSNLTIVRQIIKTPNTDKNINILPAVKSKEIVVMDINNYNSKIVELIIHTGTYTNFKKSTKKTNN